MAKNEISRPKCYPPHPDLVKYIFNELHMKKIKRTRDDAGEELSSDEKTLDKSLNKSKSKWMDRIFQETSNLIFFLECIAVREELNEEFEDEYDELFGFGFEDQDMLYMYPNNTNTFRRLILALLQTNNKESMMASFIAQQAIYQKMKKRIEDSYDWENPDIARKITDDFQYSLAWIKFFYTPGIQKTYCRRKIDSHNPVLKDEKSPEVAK